ncbi:hypothetical protein TNCT_621341 [Trichonephila clavata]|uniref:Uncharacterized protein n=1 Tax=Trichonephila clavata TaxID=2740835 RepID=A0A8X6LLX0_TRICU|nr:hypothetical protein TNCT_621341 [Trichonephila clavata]
MIILLINIRHISGLSSSNASLVFCDEPFSLSKYVALSSILSCCFLSVTSTLSVYVKYRFLLEHKCI